MGSCILLTSSHPFLRTFIVFGITRFPGSSCILPTQPWNQILLQGVWALFPEKCCLETKIWVLSVLTAPREPLFLEPLSQLCAFANTCIFTHLYFFIDEPVCILICMSPFDGTPRGAR